MTIKFPNLNKYLGGFFVYINILAILGSIIYFIYKLNWAGIIMSLVLTTIAFIILEKRLKDNAKESQTKTKITPVFIMPILVYLFFWLSAIYELIIVYTDKSIISPWEVVLPCFFLFYFLATLALVFISYTEHAFSRMLITLHYFLSFSVAIIVYKIGYGFDPFIHRATLDLIDVTGAVDPKPFYYLGQYSILITLHKIFFVPISLLDKLFVPLLAAIFIPHALFRILKKTFENKKVINLLVLFLLILPFTFFIVTTPQNYAYLLTVLIVLIGLSCSSMRELIIMYILALATFVTQPIAGIPAILFVTIKTLYHSDLKKKRKKYLLPLLLVINSIALPLAFILANRNVLIGKTTSLFSNLSFTGIFEPIISIFILSIPNTQNIFLNFIYLVYNNYSYVIFFLIISGLSLAHEHRKECKHYFNYFFFALSLLLAALLTSFLSFDYLAEYERGNFVARIVALVTIYLLPFILLSLYSLIDKILKNKWKIKLPFLLFLSVFVVTSLYLSYPRHDNYFNSRGYSTGNFDIEAVIWIENDTNGDFIVLANQQVSAGALHEYGFKKYYNENIFYYPVPTGGPLYEYYLDMVYKKPARETIVKAMDLAGVDVGYFVLNKYWWASPKIRDEAELEADSSVSFGTNDVHVFKYLRD